jgi:conjugative transfer region protein TrbK
MDIKFWVRLSAIAFVAGAVIAATLDIVRDPPPSVGKGWTERSTSADALRSSQRRCQLLVEAAARDTECLRVWAESRDRFLGVTPLASSQESR